MNDTINQIRKLRDGKFSQAQAEEMVSFFSLTSKEFVTRKEMDEKFRVFQNNLLIKIGGIFAAMVVTIVGMVFTLIINAKAIGTFLVKAGS